MSSLNSLYIKKEHLKTLFDTLEAKGEKGVSLTVSISDEGNDYGQNISAFVEQSKEQREEKKPRFYVGSGKTFWTDGKITKIEKDSTKKSESPKQESSDDLPF